MQQTKTKSAYEQKYRARLDEWQANIKRLSAQIDQADAEAKLRLAPYLERVKAKRRIVEQRLDGLRHAGTNAWDDLKQGLDDAASDLSEALEKASSRIS
jgi:hypothetical protein